MFLCIFSFTVFIVNEYFTTVKKLKICAYHILLTNILSIPKCVTLYQVTIIPSYLYSEMRELKILKDSQYVTLCHMTIQRVVIKSSNLYKLSLTLIDTEEGHLVSLTSKIMSIYFVQHLYRYRCTIFQISIYIYIYIYV